MRETTFKLLCNRKNFFLFLSSLLFFNFSLSAQIGTIQFSQAVYSVGETDGTVTFELHRVGGSIGEIFVDIQTMDGIATVADDYAGITTPLTLTWPDGNTDPKSVTLPIRTDLLVEGDEEFTATLTSTNPDWLGSPSTATIIITDVPPPSVVLRECAAIDADYCDASNPPFYNFYWFGSSASPGGSDFFGSNASNNLIFTEFDDGTALIQGTTVLGSCIAELNIKLIGKTDWTGWQAVGGTYKNMGCTNPDSTILEYYVIDETSSTITTTGGDCLEEGTYIVSQRPDPNDPETPHLGVLLGPGGALYDSDPNAEGIAGWGWMGPEGDEQRFKIDFNFLLDCDDECKDDIEEEVTVCKDAEYYWQLADKTYTAADSPVMITLTDDNGCEYKATLTINEHPKTDDVEEEVTVCEGAEYYWQLADMAYTAADSPVMITLTDDNGCEYNATLTINEGKPDDIEEMVTVCKDAEYYWQLADETYTAADSPVMITLTDDNGCEYKATLTINEHPKTDDVEEEVTVCEGAEYYWQLADKTYTAADSPVMVTLTDDNGCDYKATLTINEGKPDDIEEGVTVCKDAEYYWQLADETYTAADSPVMITLTDDNGCEYKATLTINEHPKTDDVEEEVTVCEGAEYYWQLADMAYTAADSPVMVTLTDDNGCDYKATLTINEGKPDDIEEEVTVCKDAEYYWQLADKTYTAADSPVMVTLTDDNGCEYKATLTINEHPKTDDVEEEVTVCEGAEYYWQLADMAYTAANSPVMITLEDQNGCEYKATLTINEHPATEDVEEEVTVCKGAEYYWQLADETYMASESPVMITLEDQNGCEYNATLIINEHPKTDDVKEEVTVCEDAEYYWQLADMAYTAAESPVMITLTDDNGCEYNATLTINEHPKTDDVEEEVTICEGDSYTWDITGETYRFADSPVMVTLQDDNGCDYAAKLTITEEECTGGGCETAFARYEANNTCFIDDGFNRWGWTNQFPTTDGSYTMDFYAGAGQCVITPDRKWGEVDVVFENEMVTVTVNMDPGYVLNVSQLYVGLAKYPTRNNGSPTVAPGQYPYNSGTLNEVSTYQFQAVDVSGYDQVYIIVHGDVCAKSTAVPPVAQPEQQPMIVSTYQQPFSGTISMVLDLPYDSDVNVEFLDLSGKKVKQFDSQNMRAGRHIMNYNVFNFATEVHIMQVRTKREMTIKKVLIIK